jgi:hypothetical protein
MDEVARQQIIDAGRGHLVGGPVYPSQRRHNVRDYLIKLEVEVGGPDDYDLMKARVESDLHDEEVNGYELHVVDLQQIPQSFTQAMRDDPELYDRAIDQEIGSQEFPSTSHKPSYPDDAPPHPWDQGMWIFPDDHPLQKYERLAKLDYDSEAANDKSVKERFLEAGMKALPPGGE